MDETMTDNRFDTLGTRQPDLLAALRTRQSEALVRFIHISDTHISPDPAYILPEAAYPPGDGARELVRQINALPFKPDFILHTGDVAFDPVDEAYTAARAVFSELAYPIYYLAGNHDSRELLQRTLLGLPQARPTFDYEFEVNGVQIICLDSSTPAQFAGGTLTVEQLDWLDRLLRQPDTRPLVVAIHHNILPIGAPFWDEFMRLTNGEDLHRLLLQARGRLRGVFFGHVHMATDTYRDGIYYHSVPSSWYQLECYPEQENIQGDLGAEPGFSVVTISRSGMFIRRHRFHVPPTQIPRIG
jgi:3',5'-cyclic AMP phosphodiesterase CpdA